MVNSSTCRVDQCERRVHERELGLCQPHGRQFHLGRPLSPIKLRRSPGAQQFRDDQGRKYCPLCVLYKPESDFYNCASAPDGLQFSCKACHRQRYYIEKPEKVERIKYAKYGMTPADYQRMLKAQSGRCAACGTTDTGQNPTFVVDHDHNCCPYGRSCGSCVRGLLCSPCNVALGCVKDDVDRLYRLIDYLSRQSGSSESTPP